MTQSQKDHAEKHCQKHQTDSHNNGSQSHFIAGEPVFLSVEFVLGVISLTQWATVASSTDTYMLAPGLGCAGSSIEAGLYSTVLRGPVAVAAGDPWGAAAGVVIDAVYAGGAISTGVTGTLINVDFTSLPREA